MSQTDPQHPQQLRIISITIKSQETLSKEFYNYPYVIQVLINSNLSKTSPLIHFPPNYNQLDFDFPINFNSQLESAKFQLINKDYQTVVFEGTFNTLPSDLNKVGTFEYNCDIRNSKKEKINLKFLYTNSLKENIPFNSETEIEKKNEDIYSLYNSYLKEYRMKNQQITGTIRRVSESTSTKSDVSLLDLATGENAKTFKQFVKNVDYVKGLINVVLDFIFWKEPHKTITILSIFTIFILYTNFFVLILSILLLILFHLSYRDAIVDNFSYKNSSCNISANLQIVMWIMELTNNLFGNLENLFESLQNNSRELFKEVYINLLKLVLWNIPLYFVINYTMKKVELRYIITVLLWTFILMLYPKFRAFLMVLIRLVFGIINDLVEKKWNKKMFISEKKVLYFIEIVVPFFSLGRHIYKLGAKNVIKEMNNKPEIVIAQDKKDENKLKQMLKYEVYEKQRWRIVDWSGNLDEGDGAPFVKIGNNKNIYFNWKNLQLPGEQYEWKNDWEVEVNQNTDQNGWEYAKSFDDELWKKKDDNCKVRRRKLFRYAGLK